ncbi:MAG: hypothetical protein WD688_01430 [Candidatus Binatia bacterium]
MIIRFSFGLLALLLLFTQAVASNHYTEKQLNALAIRVGRIFWTSPANGKLPLFLAAPAADASSFHPAANQSFEITELVGRKSKNPYYKVKFESGKEGYIHAQDFHEQFNMTLVTIDPLADEKKVRAQQDEEEKARIAWIQSQPWSSAVKEAASKRQAVSGMTVDETKKVLGNPRRINQIKGPQHVTEEHWFYADSVLIFRNGVLNRLDMIKKTEP